MRDKERKSDQPAKDQPRHRPAKKPYIKPTVTDGDPLENVTLLSGGANPSTAEPFVH